MSTGTPSTILIEHVVVTASKDYKTGEKFSPVFSFLPISRQITKMLQCALMETFVVKDVGELEAVAKRVLAVLDERKREDGSAVLALHGDLGAGKTTFMQILARMLEVEEVVVSPTFVVMKHYELPEEQHGFTALYHLDAYRIETVDEMRPLRFAELLTEPKALIAIEWAERIAELLPTDTIDLTFTISGETRTITLT